MSGPRKIRSRQEGEHRRGCLAVESAKRREWRSPWGCLDSGELRGGSARIYRDKNGRPHQHPTQAWLRYICNDIRCRAVLLVNEMDVADMAEAQR